MASSVESYISILIRSDFTAILVPIQALAIILLLIGGVVGGGRIRDSRSILYLSALSPTLLASSLLLLSASIHSYYGDIAECRFLTQMAPRCNIEGYVPRFSSDILLAAFGIVILSFLFALPNFRQVTWNVVVNHLSRAGTISLSILVVLLASMYMLSGFVALILLFGLVYYMPLITFMLGVAFLLRSSKVMNSALRK